MAAPEMKKNVAIRSRDAVLVTVDCASPDGISYATAMARVYFRGELSRGEEMLFGAVVDDEQRWWL